MKKIFSLLIVLIMMGSILPTTVSAAQTGELGQLKICKVAGSGVTQGQLFSFTVDGNRYNVPAGPPENGYCVLAGQYPLNTQLTIEEVIPSGYYVARIEVKPNRTVTKNTAQGNVVIEIGSGVTEAIFTNRIVGSPTPTPTLVNTATPRPTNTATSTPVCSPNCTPTSTPIPMGRMQICKEADGAGVTGYFTFRFDTRSRSVPVGACAGIISVEAGRLTITEVAQAGYEVTDIYTIPANRLISKNLSGGNATVSIVEGAVASQTIIVFRNRAIPSNGTNTPTRTPTASLTATGTPPTLTSTATPTSTVTGTPPTSTQTFTPTSTGTVTPTFTATPTGSVTPTFTPTPTGTTPPPVCPPAVISANFNNIQEGQSVEGLGAVAPYLNIDAKGTALKVAEGEQPFLYFASGTGTSILNGGIVSSGGFSDVSTQQMAQGHLYTFTFAPFVSVDDFSLHMLDFGDLNPALDTNHYASMTAYNANGAVVAKQELSYTTLAEALPSSSDLYGDLRTSGDATGAAPGEPGNWTWHVSGSGIVKVVLEFGEGYDPNIAFDLLTVNVICR